jgi:hypothetical protein
VLLDHGEEIAEEGALVSGELARDRVSARRGGTVGRLANPGVSVAIGVAQLDAGRERPVRRGARYAGCALLRRNRMASWCLASQST